MQHKKSVGDLTSVLVTVLFVATILFSAINSFAQNRLSVVSATELVKRVETSQPISYENITIDGDFDLSNLSKRTNDAVYPEKSKTARVFSANVTQPIIFRNVVFNGKLDFFRRVETANEIKEYRVVFDKAVTFENCTFNQTTDFELTNFNGGVSFAHSRFKDKPSFVRVGLEKTPNFAKVIFENGSIFKNFQNDAPRNLTPTELETFYREYIESDN